MPERQLTQEEQEWYKSQGIDPSNIVATTGEDTSNKMSSTDAALATAKAHTGGYLGGGAGAIGAGALASWTLGPEVGLPATLIAGALGGFGGGYAGQKAQDVIQGDTLTQELQQKAALAAEQHPYISSATDIGASALLSGGKPNLSNIPKAITGNKEAIAKLALSSLVNPAINTGLDYAITGNAPTAGDIAKQAIGGALFSEPAKWASRLQGHTEPSPEPTQNTENDVVTPPTTEESQNIPLSPYKMTDGEGNPIIDNIRIRNLYKQKINPRPSYEGLTDEQRAIKATAFEKGNKVDIDTMREALHNKFLQDLSAQQPEVKLPTTVKQPEPEPTVKVESDNKIAEPTPAIEQGDELPKYSNLGDVAQAPKQESENDDSLLYKQKQDELRKMIQDGDMHSPEFIQKWKEVEALKNKNGGNVPTNDKAQAPVNENTLGIENGAKLFNHIMSGKATVGSVLEHIQNSNHSMFSPLAKYFLEKASSEKLSDKVKYNPILGLGDNPRSHYDSKAKSIQLEYQHISNPYVLMHEVGHSLIYHALPPEFRQLSGKDLYNAMVDYKMKNGGNEHVKELVGSYLEAAKQLGVHDTLFKDTTQSASIEPGRHLGEQDTIKYNIRKGLAGQPDKAQDALGLHGYFMGDLHEFLTGIMSDKSFQQKLNEMPSGLSNGKSMWTRLVEAIRNILGVPVKDGSLLERALRANDNLIGQERPLSFNEKGSRWDAREEAFKPSNKEKTEKDFTNLGKLQRGKPENAMLDIQHAMGGGVLNPLVENVGDLMHRANDPNTFDRAGREYVLNKINNELYHLESKYGFEREFKENLVTNARYNKVPLEEFTKKVDDSLKAFRDAHEELPTFNKAQELMKQAAIAVGEKRWKDAENILREIKSHTKTDAEWKAFAHEGLSKEEHILQTPKTKNEREERPIPPTYHMGKVGEIFRSGIDTIRSLAHLEAGRVATAAHKVFNERDSYLGKQLNPIIEAAKKNSFSKQDDAAFQRIQRYEMENKKPAPAELFTSKAVREVYNEAKKSLKENYEERLRNKEPINDNGVPRLPKRDEFYWPTTGNPKLTQVIRDNTNPVAMAALKKEWNDYYTQKLGFTPEKAMAAFNEYQKHVQGSSESNSAGAQTYFNAARQAQGNPLPPSFTRPGSLRNLEAYFHAQSMDNAFYKHIESNPRVMSALGYSKDPWGNKVPQAKDGVIAGNTAVKNVIDQMKGEVRNGQQGQVIAKSESLATAALLGPLTEFHKVVSNVVKQLSTFTDNPYQAAKIFAKGITNFGEGWTHAKQNGKIVMTANQASDMWNSQLTAADKLAGVARAIRQVYTLNDLTDKFNVGMLQSMNEALIPLKLKLANEGDRTAQRLMQQIEPDWQPNKKYNANEISKMASNLTGIIHGTRDARTMPSWMLHDNEISSFFKLSSWGIAQTNSFMRDVYTPALEGNIKPLLMSTFGAAVGGYLIKELRQDIAGKKSQIPSLAEIESSSRGLKGNVPALAYNMIAASSYAGFGGMLSTIARYPFDAAFKNTPQGATFPLDTVVSDLGKTAYDVAQTIENDPNINWLELSSHVAAHLLGSSFQLGRVAMNHAIDSGFVTGTLAEKKALSDKMGELRRFDIVEGLPYQEQSAQEGNPYMDLEQKKFKQTQDVGEAAQQLPQLIHNILVRYSDKPDVMLEKLKGLKENQYATMPNLDSMPLEFSKYLSYLTKMKGPQAAQDALTDYFHHKIINEVKSSLIP